MTIKNITLKKILSVFMSIVLLSGTIGTCVSIDMFVSEAFAADVEEKINDDSILNGTCGENITWNLYKETGELFITGTGEMYNESGSSAPWESDVSYIKTVHISDGVTFIGWAAFRNCTQLTTIYLPDSVTSIGIYAFENCYGLKNVVMGNNVRIVGNYAFSGCKNLTDVYFFGNESEWNEIIFMSNNEDFLNANIHFAPDYSTTGVCGDNLTWSLDKSMGELTISGTGDMYDYGTGDTANYPMFYSFVPWYNFRNIIKTVKLEKGITSIGVNAFYSCDNLTDVIIPDSVTKIKAYSFYGCQNLISVSIPKNVSYIEDDVFSCCFSLSGIFVDKNNIFYSNDENGVLFNKEKTSLICYPNCGPTNYAIPEGVINILDSAFFQCEKITEVIVPKSLKNIGNDAFRFSEIKSINLPEGLTSIGDSAFWACQGLSKIEIPSTVLNIGKSAFVDCDNITSVEIPGGIKIIQEFTFAECDGLTCVTIPEGITAIGSYVFFGCDNLTNITIPKSLSYMEEQIFEWCDKLTGIYYNGTKEQWNKIKGLDLNQELEGINIHFKEQLRKNSNNDDVIVECFDDAYKGNVYVDVAKIPVNAGDYNFALSEFSEDELIPVANYDITVKNNDGSVADKPNNKVTVKLRIPDGIVISENGVHSKTVKIIHRPKAGGKYEIIENNNLKYENGYIVFEVEHFSYFLVCVETEAPTIKICNNPGTATINYGDMLWLTAEATNLPEGAQVWWFFDSGFGASGNSIGTTVYRDSVVTVKILDSEGNVLKDADGNEITDTQNIVCKSNIWLRIISFFKNLFRIERTIIQNL